MKGKKRSWLMPAGILIFALVMLLSLRSNAEAAVKQKSIVTADGNLAKGFSVKLSKTRYAYRGGLRIVPALTVKNGSKTLTEGKDYKFWTVNAKQIGTATLKIKGLGAYKGLYKTSYAIVRRPARGIFARTRYQTYAYNGKARKPGVVINIKADGKTIFLKNGRDFKLSYRDNREPGTGKVLVTFMGNYSGKKTLTFAIRRLSPTPTPARITKVTPTPTATPKPVVTAKPTPTPAIVPVPETPMDGKHLTAAWYASLLEKENFVFSPYSLRDCASILYPAAGGTSKKEMEDVLGLSEAVSAALKKSDAEAIFTKGIGMKSANKAYINTLDAAMAHANTDALDTDQIDLRPFNGSTWQDINQYVARATENKIQNLLGADDVGEDTSAVLLNCLYFMNTWAHEEGTLLWNGTKKVDSFRDDSSLKDIKEDGAIDILRLPYSNIPKNMKTPAAGMDTYAMYILCDSDASANVGVDAYMAGLSEERLAEITDFSAYKGLSGYDKAWFNVPDFETRTRTSLKELLAKLGATEIFTKGAADFRKFADIYIDAILQEAYIKTDSEGTEAAAATAIISKATAAFHESPPKIKRVIADTTFAFVLKDDTTGQILFVGRISNP